MTAGSQRQAGLYLKLLISREGMLMISREGMLSGTAEE
jgi:hypothetical protein